MHEHRARKRFGQHFLCDESVIHHIVDSIAPTPTDAIVEIGPGLSAITHALLEKLPHLTVIELDRDLANRLRTNDRLSVMEADVLQVDFSRLAKDMTQTSPSQKIRVVGNLPYNISTPLLFHLLAYVDVIGDHHFMLQKEVVDRMAATPCHRDYGRLSVMLQWRYDITALFDVAPDSFRPPPKVMSSIVRMIPKTQWLPLEAALLETVTRIAFSQRRKLLRHTLGKWLEEKAYAGHFDVQRRAEEVNVSEYAQLTLDLMEQSTKRHADHR